MLRSAARLGRDCRTKPDQRGHAAGDGDGLRRAAGQVGGADVTLSGGVASYTTSALPAGPQTITVLYAGDANY